jgi:aminocarboxymuconate-semialdehyde decarboxylase
MIIDVHGHITHPELLRKLPMPPALGDIEGMLERKAAAGIELTIVGSPVGFGTMMRMAGIDNYAQPADRVRSFNEWLSQTAAKHDGLEAYAYTNPFGGEELLESTAETVSQGGFVGLIVNTSVEGHYLDSERCDPFFAMASELGLPVFLHPPAEPVGSESVEDFRLVEQVGRFCDVTLSLATLVFAGRLEQYPDLSLVAATAGGAIGLLTGRLDAAYRPTHWGGGPPGGGPPGGGPPRYENRIATNPSEHLANVYVDTANASLPNHLANLELMGAKRMMFGTDSPPLATPFEAAIDMIRRLPIEDADREKIFEGNARRLFGL